MYSIIVKLSRIVQRTEEVLLASSILLIALLTIANVIGRMFGHPLVYAEEVSQYCIIVVTFVGLSYAASRGRHIRMSALYDQLGADQRRLAMIFINGITSMLLFVLAWYSCLYVRTVYQLGGIYPVLRVPFYVVYAAAPLGLFLGAIQYTLTTIKNLVSDAPHLSFESPDAYCGQFEEEGL